MRDRVDAALTTCQYILVQISLRLGKYRVNVTLPIFTIDFSTVVLKL